MIAEMQVKVTEGYVTSFEFSNLGRRAILSETKDGKGGYMVEDFGYSEGDYVYHRSLWSSVAHSWILVSAYRNNILFHQQDFESGVYESLENRELLNQQAEKLVNDFHKKNNQ
jgi:hypothetical protein